MWPCLRCGKVANSRAACEQLKEQIARDFHMKVTMSLLPHARKVGGYCESVCKKQKNSRAPHVLFPILLPPKHLRHSVPLLNFP